METTLSKSRTVNKNILAAIIFLALFIALILLARLWQQSFDFGVDWKGAFRPAALHMLRGESPYLETGFHNPPWALLPLIPIALLPESWGSAAMLVLNFFAYGFIAYRLGAKPLPLAAFLLSPVVIFNGSNGNLDWLCALGFVLPPQIGLFFVLVKPQIGAGLALFWVVEAWRKGKAREVARVFTPLAAVTLLSFVLYGLWPLQMAGMPDDPYNKSMWPLSIPIGLALLVYAIRNRNKGLSLTASPFLTPYLTIHSYAPALLGLGVNSAEMLIAVAALWAMKIARLY